MSLTDEQKMVWWNDSTHKSYRLHFLDSDIADIGNSRICSESMTITDSLCAEEDIVFGSCCSAQFEIQIANLTDEIKGLEFEAYATCDGVEIQLGTCTVYSAEETSNKQYKKVTAYDRMNRLNEDVSDWYASLFKDDTTEIPLKQFRDSFFEYIGLPQETISLINDDLIVRKTVSSNRMTGIEVMQAVCEINGVFGHFDRSGVFCYVSISNDEELMPKYITSDYEDYNTQGINRLQIRQESGDIGYATEPIADVKENGYIVTGNFLMYGMSQDELKLYGDRLFAKIQGITYKPSETQYIGLPYIELGKRCSISSSDGNFSSIIMSHTLSGGQYLMSEISASGNQYRSEAIDGLNYEFNQLMGKTNILERTVEGTVSKVADLEVEINGEKGIATIVQQLSGQIITEVIAGGETVSRFSQELGRFLFEGDTFEINTDNIRIKGNVLEISDGYIGNLRIGSEGLSSDDYETLQIFRDGTGKFTNLSGNGKGSIYLKPKKNEEDEDEEAVVPFFKTKDGFHADYDSVSNKSANMHCDSAGYAHYGLVSGDMESSNEAADAEMVIKPDGVHIQKGDGTLLPLSASNIPKLGFSKINFINSTFKPGQTSDYFFNKYIRDINHVYSFFDEVEKYAESAEYMYYRGSPYKYVMLSYEDPVENTVHFFFHCGNFNNPELGGNTPFMRISNLGGDQIGFHYAQMWNGGGNFKQPFIDITYKIDTGEMSWVGRYVTYDSSNPTNNQYIISNCSNISLYFPNGISKCEIRMFDSENKNGSFFYQASEGVLRKDAIDGTIIAKVTQGGIDESSINALSLEDDFTLKAGENVSIKATPATKEIEISAKTYEEATKYSPGLFTPEEKEKLNSIEQGAEVNVQSDWNETDSSSDSYISNKPSSLPASDVYDWAKKPEKPQYTYDEVGAEPSGTGEVVYEQAKKYADNAVSNAFTKENVTNALGYTPLNQSLKGSASGLAELDSNGKVPSSQLPSFVDDVVEGYLSGGKFYKESAHTTEISGETGKIYIDLSTEKTYRWSGSAFVVISETLALGETSSTAYRGDRGKTAYDHSQSAHAPSNAQANVIEIVKVNGTALTPSNKAVNVTVPTKVSELTNDSGFKTTDAFADIIRVSNGTDFNSCCNTGVYFFDSYITNYVNYPDSFAHNAILFVNTTGSRTTQICISCNTEKMYTRTSTYKIIDGVISTWTNWKEISVKGHKHLTSEIEDFPKNATATEDGLMSSTDKKYLEWLNLNIYKDENDNLIIESNGLKYYLRSEGTEIIGGDTHLFINAHGDVYITPESRKTYINGSIELKTDADNPVSRVDSVYGMACVYQDSLVIGDVGNYSDAELSGLSPNTERTNDGATVFVNDTSFYEGLKFYKNGKYYPLDYLPVKTITSQKISGGSITVYQYGLMIYVTFNGVVFSDTSGVVASTGYNVQPNIFAAHLDSWGGDTAFAYMDQYGNIMVGNANTSSQYWGVLTAVINPN